MITYINISVTLGINHSEDIEYQVLIDEVMSEMDYDFNYSRKGIEIVETRINGQVEDL